MENLITNEYKIINTGTGETNTVYLKENEQFHIKKVVTEKEKTIINNKDELKRTNKLLGGFIRVMYVENELLFNRIGLDSSNVARVLYLATYMDYENRNDGLLVKKVKRQPVPMTRKDLFEVMKLGNTPFKAFLSAMKKAGLLIEKEKLFYLNTKYFGKGEVNKKETYTRLYIDTTKTLYEGCTSRQHKQLGYILQLIPYASYDLNMLEHEGKRLSIENMCELLGLSTERKSTSKLHNELKKFTFKLDGKEYYLFGMVVTNDFTGYCINPLASYRGNDIREMKTIIKLMLFNKTVEELNRTYRKKVK